jgi:hypothetical protein
MVVRQKHKGVTACSAVTPSVIDGSGGPSRGPTGEPQAGHRVGAPGVRGAGDGAGAGIPWPGVGPEASSDLRPRTYRRATQDLPRVQRTMRLPGANTNLLPCGGRSFKGTPSGRQVKSPILLWGHRRLREPRANPGMTRRSTQPYPPSSLGTKRRGDPLSSKKEDRPTESEP